MFTENRTLYPDLRESKRLFQRRALIITHRSKKGDKRLTVETMLWFIEEAESVMRNIHQYLHSAASVKQQQPESDGKLPVKTEEGQ